MKTCITGGAGFIGTALSKALLAAGHHVTVVDCFSEQIHGSNKKLPEDIEGHVHLVRGDVRDPVVWESVLPGQQVVVHLAAETGTGQSMYEVSRYQQVNVGGTANLYQLLMAHAGYQVEKILIASSRAIYGEGAYRCAEHGVVYPKSRPAEDKDAGKFDPLCPQCGSPSQFIPTPEEAPFQPSSYYGLTKQVQEQTTLLFGEVLNIPSIALRYQNVFGPGQSLKNPYTGLLAVFSNLARENRDINVFEDGQESRDFVYIDDVVKATVAAIEKPVTGTHAINVGSGVATSVLTVAQLVLAFFASQSKMSVSGNYRKGDIRHGLADLRKAGELLGFKPDMSFVEGLHNFLRWACESEPETGRFEASLREMEECGLFRASGQQK